MMAFNVNQFMMNPWTNMGLGTLAASRPGVPFGQALGAGMLSGMQNLQLMQEAKQTAEARQLNMERIRAQMEKAKQDAAMQAEMQKRAQEFVQENPQFQNLYATGGIESVSGVLEAQAKERLKTTNDYRNWELAGKPGRFEDWMTREAASRSPVTNVNIMPPGKEKFTEKYAEREATALADKAEQIPGKIDVIESLDEAEKFLNSKEGIYSGYWGEYKLKGAKALGVNPEKASNTETFLAYVTETVLPRMEAFGGNDSNEEMLLIKKMVGGEITLELNTLKRLVKSARRKLSRTVDNYNKRVKRVQKDFPDWQPPSIAEPYPGPQQQTAPQSETGVTNWSDM